MLRLTRTLSPALLLCWSPPASADIFSAPDTPPASIHSTYGGVGLIKTRTARMAPDSTFASTISWNDQQQRYGLTFQAAPWLEASFNYSGFELANRGQTYDRQFDLKIRLWEESLYVPTVAIGLQDFLGTGIFSGEYIVASKQIGPLDLSFGVGWGRLGSRADFENPLRAISSRFDNRDADTGLGGEVNFGQFFQGQDVGFFGGVSYQTPIDGLQLIAEYDSDDNSPVRDRNDNPLNLGLVYNVTPGIQLTASYLGLEDVNLQASFSAPVGEALADKPAGDIPPLYYVREDIPEVDGGLDGLVAPIAPPLFTPLDIQSSEFSETLKNDLKRQGLTIVQLETGTEAIRLRVKNTRYRSSAKAVGRAARILSRYAPKEIETFQIVLDERGLEVAEFKLSRTLLEQSAREVGYSLAPPSLSFAYITPGSAPVDGQVSVFDDYPTLDWRVGPDLRYGLFDPNDPLRLELRAEASARVDIARGLSISTAISTEVVGNLSDRNQPSNSVIPRVRTEADRYSQETDVGLFRLEGEYLFSPAPNVYGKVSAGLLEQMFGGFGGELLYRPENSRLAFGGELYYAKQRDFDTLLSFRDYDVVTGHASIYYDTPYAHWNAALHAGRYLAGDWGATVELSRRFPNGWEVGAFATLTDVPFSDFGEGSFDKGITLSIPFDWGLKRDTKSKGSINLRPIQRDGGQRLSLATRLFDVTRDGSREEVEPQWNTFAH